MTGGGVGSLVCITHDVQLSGPATVAETHAHVEAGNSMGRGREWGVTRGRTGDLQRSF